MVAPETYQGYNEKGEKAGDAVSAKDASNEINVEKIGEAIQKAGELINNNYETLGDKINDLIEHHSAAVQISGVNFYNTQLLLENAKSGNQSFISESNSLLVEAEKKHDDMQRTYNKDAYNQAQANAGANGSVSLV